MLVSSSSSAENLHAAAPAARAPTASLRDGCATLVPDAASSSAAGPAAISFHLGDPGELTRAGTAP
jgi:hypothetical protein